MIIVIIVQVNALLETLELTESAQRKGHFSLYNCLILGHTKFNGVQRVYCNPFPAKPFYGSHRLDPVMIRPPGLDHGAFVVSPDSVWYAQVAQAPSLPPGTRRQARRGGASHCRRCRPTGHPTGPADQAGRSGGGVAAKSGGGAGRGPPRVGRAKEGGGGIAERPGGRARSTWRCGWRWMVIRAVELASD